MLNHKTTIFIAALAVGAAVATTDASAFSLAGGYAGPVRFIYANFDAATTGYPPTTGTICTNVLSCDAAGTNPAPNAVGSEDTWGVFSISQILDPYGTVLWSPTPGGEQLHGMFYGLADQQVTYNGQWTTYSRGGSLDLYLNNTACNASLGTSGRTSASTYNCYTSGTLALSTVFSPTANANLASSTYTTTYSGSTIAGHGQGFLDITGGSLQALFDTNSMGDVGTPTRFHDFLLDTTFSCPTGEIACTPSSTNLYPWSVTSGGEVKGNAAVPEPGVLLLMGAGLFGLSGIRQHKSRTV